MPEADYETQMTTHWLQSGIGPREAAAKLQPACGDVAPPDETTLQKLEAEWRAKPDATAIVYRLLGDVWHRLAGIVCKTVESPADYVALLDDLSAITDDQFAIEDAEQIMETDTDVQLQFVHEGDEYSLRFEDHGRWCNLGGVLKGLESILERVGLAERFIELSTGGDEVAIVAFVRPDKFLPAARELGIRLERPSSGS